MKKHPESDGSFTVAFPELFPRARALAQRILGDRALAEDVAAEAMARAYVRWDRIGGSPARSGWVLRVTSNLALDVLRHQQVRRRVLAELGVQRPPEDDPALRLALVQALGRLPKRQRESVVLRHLGGLTRAEVAATLGVGVGSVARHLHRGLAALRQDLGDLHMDGVRMKISSIEEAAAALESGEVLQARVLEALPGRLAVDVGIPAVYRHRGEHRVGDQSGLVGTDIPCVVTGIDRDSATVRTATPIPTAELAAFERRSRALAGLAPGDVRRGRVGSLVSFGAFVEVGELTGLVHSSELGGATPAVGDELDVEVLQKDPETLRISLRPYVPASLDA
ncbi:MAG TPA: sigma-70 family RNA polymerase sigma factor [Mycobacteriales bacterium]|nr:sigma-70 family RNA polymerase sigma factor [Mycobacteriales bacterium]